LRRFVGKIFRAESATFAALLTAGAQVLIVAINLVTGVITARMLGAEGRGIFAAVTIWPQFLSGLAQMGLSTASVYLIRKTPSEGDRIVSATLVLTVLAGAVGTAVGIVAVALTMQRFDAGSALLADFCVLWTTIYMLTISLRQAAVARGEFSAFNISSLLSPISYLVFLVIAWLCLKFDTTVAVICLMASSLPTLLQLGVSTTRRAHLTLDGLGPWHRAILHFAVRAAPMEVAANLAQYVDKLALIYMISADEIGLYMIGYSLSRVMLVLQTVIVSVLYPSMSGRSNVEMKLLHDRAFRILVALVVVSVALMYLFGEHLLRFVYGQEFAAAAVLLDILVLEAGVSCIAQVVIQLYLSMGRPSFASAAQVIGLAATVVGIAVLVTRMGASGAAVGMLLGTGVRLGVLLAGLPIVLRVKVPFLILSRDDVSFILAKIS
jgi:O-antigen/teichoic acid export membrane protein